MTEIIVNFATKYMRTLYFLLVFENDLLFLESYELNFREIKLLSEEMKSCNLSCDLVDIHGTNLFETLQMRNCRHFQHKLSGSWKLKNHNIDTLFLRSHICHDYKNLCFEMDSHFFQELGLPFSSSSNIWLNSKSFTILISTITINHHNLQILVKLTENFYGIK